MSLELEVKKNTEAVEALTAHIAQLNAQLGCLPNLTFATSAEGAGTTLDDNGNYAMPAEVVQEDKEAPKTPAKSKSRVRPAAAAPVEEDDPVEEDGPVEEAVTIEDARKIAMDVSTKLGKDVLKGLLKKHNADRISGVEDFGAFVKTCDAELKKAA